MRKHDQSSAAAEGARRATGAAAERDRKGRFSARRKRATVLRLLRGEDLESVSRELGITAARGSRALQRIRSAGGTLPYRGRRIPAHPSNWAHRRRPGGPPGWPG